MKPFGFFKSIFYAFMGLFMKAIPFVCLPVAIWGCWDCIKNKHISLLYIVIIVLNFVGGILFLYLIFESFFSRIFKSYKKVWKIILNIIFNIGSFFFLCLFICGYINAINLCGEYFLSWILIVLTLFSILLYALRNKFLLYSTSISLIVYRFTLLVSITISSLLYIALSVKNYLTDGNLYSYCSLLTALLSLWIVYLYFYHDFAYINYKRSQYVLFLRNFAMDDRICEAKLLLEIEYVCNRFRLFLMRIGNPKTIFDSSPGKTFYLKTVNWKAELQNKIKDAKIIFVVISNSDGLFWEIFNHLQYSSKFIYHILDISKMRNDLNDGKYDQIKYTKLGGILYFICGVYGGPFAYNDSGAFGISFTFNNNYLILSCNALHVVEYLFKQQEMVNTEYCNVIKLEYDEELKNEIIYYHDAKYLINNIDYYD
jgi:hypothetical protein